MTCNECVLCRLELRITFHILRQMWLVSIVRKWGIIEKWLIQEQHKYRILECIEFALQQGNVCRKYFFRNYDVIMTSKLYIFSCLLAEFCGFEWIIQNLLCNDDVISQQWSPPVVQLTCVKFDWEKEKINNNNTIGE